MVRRQAFPRNSYRAMEELIADRITKTMRDQQGQEVQKKPAEVMADAILEGMEGKLTIGQTEKRVTYANPLHAVKLYHDYMLKAKELELKTKELEKKEKGPGGGIRIVLLNPVVDPLSRPGQKPRPLRLLGQDPSRYDNDRDGRTGVIRPGEGSAACINARRRLRSSRDGRGLRAPGLRGSRSGAAGEQLN